MHAEGATCLGPGHRNPKQTCGFQSGNSLLGATGPHPLLWALEHTEGYKGRAVKPRAKRTPNPAVTQFATLTSPWPVPFCPPPWW